MEVEIISVHFPKAGGSSLRQSFVAAYGKDAVHFDYTDDPADPCSCYSLDPDGCRRKAREVGCAPGVKVVHGHFHPSKYELMSNAKKITFLRHPVDNLISIYYFWKTLKEGHCLLNYARNSQLGLLDVARLPAIRYLLSRTYFGGVDMDTFDFIGFMESYAEDLRMLSGLLSIPIVESKENFNRYPGYQDKVGAIRSDNRLMSTLHDCLIEDIRFYERIKMRRVGQSTA
jgi:hypothetical protein